MTCHPEPWHRRHDVLDSGSHIMTQTATDTTDDLQEALGEVEAQEFKKRSVSGAISYTLRSLFLYGIGLVTAFILAAHLSVEAFGIYGIVTQIVGLLQFFSDVGLGPALIQKKTNPTLKEYRVVFTVQQLLSWLLFLAVALLATTGWLTPKLGIEGIWVLLALGFSFPLSSLKIVPAIILERKLEFSKLVTPSIFEQIVYNVVLVYLVLNGMGVMAYAYAVILRGIIGVIAMYFVQGWSVGLSLHYKTIRSIIGTGVKFQLSDFLARIKDQLFYLALGKFLPLREFGYISWSKSWSQVPYMLTVQNVIAITFPAYSRLQHDKKRLQKAIEKSIFFITLSIFPILVGMSVFIWPLTQIVDKYAKWEMAVPTFIFFTLSIAWAAISTPLTNTLNAIGQINKTLKLMLMWTGLTWMATPIFIWQFGFNGVALAALLISFTSILPIYMVKQHITLNIWDQVWRQLLASVVMAGVGVIGLQAWSASFRNLLLGMIVVGSSYLLALSVIGFKKLKYELESLLSRR